MKVRHVASLMMCVTLLFSCSSSRFGWTPEAENREGKETHRMAEDFDPLILDDDDIVIEETGGQQVPRTQKPREAEEDTAEPEKAGPVMVPGFRVQLMSGKDEAQILEEKKKAMFKFQQSIYVVFESPYYKIRLGDFLSHTAAAAVQEEVRRKGFPGAFIAKCPVDRTKAVQ